MSSIRILPDQVANRIAAGEVIERPVAVVKELVDNSIDAGSSHIRVQFRQGGKSYIRVEDDGSGMSADDALLSLERHATSKIQSSEDLFNIRTLGFRGEAIPSIARVSRYLMRTRRGEDQEGTEILVNGGKLIHRKAVGTPPGTQTEVTHLFSSIPARRKFLKTDNTEASHIIQWMRLISLAHPGIAFRLLSNNRTLIQLPAHEQWLDRITSLWGRDLEHQLLRVEFEAEGVQGSGYIGRAGVSRPSRQDIVTIVNGRPVESRTLGFAFTEAYHTHIPKGRYPIVFVRLQVDPSLVDVNIHPSKKEIKFKNESHIRTMVIQTVWQALRAKTDIRPPGPEVQAVASPPKPESRPKMEERSGNTGKEPTDHWKTGIATQKQSGSDPVSDSSGSSRSPALRSQERKATESSVLQKDWRFIGDFQRVYSLFERSSGLTMIHATRARRRIEFERILKQLDDLSKTSQEEILPVTFELDLVMSGRLQNLLSVLGECAIVIEEFGRNFFRIERVPSFLDGETAKQFVIDCLQSRGEADSDPGQLKSRLALLCCGRQTEKLDLPLSRSAAFHLLESLLHCEQPMVDPDGKPAVLHFSHRVFEQFQGESGFPL